MAEPIGDETPRAKLSPPDEYDPETTFDIRHPEPIEPGEWMQVREGLRTILFAHVFVIGTLGFGIPVAPFLMLHASFKCNDLPDDLLYAASKIRLCLCCQFLSILAAIVFMYPSAFIAAPQAILRFDISLERRLLECCLITFVASEGFLILYLADLAKALKLRKLIVSCWSCLVMMFFALCFLLIPGEHGIAEVWLLIGVIAVSHFWTARLLSKLLQALSSITSNRSPFGPSQLPPSGIE